MPVEYHWKATIHNPRLSRIVVKSISLNKIRGCQLNSVGTNAKYVC